MCKFHGKARVLGMADYPRRERNRQGEVKEVGKGYDLAG
jgi:hypothetical protein